MKKSLKILITLNILIFSMNLIGCHIFVDNIKIQERGMFESSVIKYYEENQKDGKAVATFRDLTDFEWDKVYLFSIDGASDEFLEKYQIDYDEKYKSPHSGVVFLKNDNVVYEEVFPVYYPKIEYAWLFNIKLPGESREVFLDGTEKFFIYLKDSHYLENQIEYHLYPCDEWYKNGLEERYKNYIY